MTKANETAGFAGPVPDGALLQCEWFASRNSHKDRPMGFAAEVPRRSVYKKIDIETGLSAGRAHFCYNICL